jgi:ribosomal subunit interface protein
VLRITGKNIDIGTALRGKVEERVASMADKYFDGGYSGQITVSKDGTSFRTDCILHLDTGRTLHAIGQAHDAYASFGEAAEHLEKRLRRHKRRLKDPSSTAKSAASGALSATYTVMSPLEEDQDIADETYHPAIIAESSLTLRRLSVGDAVLDLDLTGAPFVVFRHSASGKVNVVYRRADGHIGWIDPQDAASH